MRIDPAARRVLAAQADTVADHERRWQRSRAARAADGHQVEPDHHEPFAHLAAARHLLGVGVAAAMVDCPVPRRAHMSHGEVFLDMTFVAAERLLEAARTRQAAPSAYGYAHRCLWCGRDRHAGAGETPGLQPEDTSPHDRPDEPDRLWHTTCFTAYQRGQGVIAALYRHRPGHALTVLDEVVIATGLMRRCLRCAATTPTDQRCIECGAGADSDSDSDSEPVDGVRDGFAAHRSAPEAVWTIPAPVDGQPPLRLGIAALGGGTLGRAYANNGWLYGLWTAGRLVACGADLYSGAAGRTHHEMGLAAAEQLAGDPAIGQDIRQRLTDWTDGQRTSPTHPIPRWYPAG